MDTRTISNLIDVSLCLVALFIAVRSFDVYFRLRYRRLFVLGLSMSLVSLSAAVNFTASYVKVITLNTDWFLYISQSVGLLFILLSFASSSDKYLRNLIRLNLLVLPPLLLLLFLSPVLPVIPDTLTRTLLGGPRFAISFMIFFAYFFAFTGQPTHFNRFMSISFFLLSFGYLMAVGQDLTLASGQHFLGNIGNITNVLGLVALIFAVSWN